MLWIKAFHVIFMVTWFAGLFYLPRLFIYHHQATAPAELQNKSILRRIGDTGAVQAAKHKVGQLFGIAE